MAKKASKKKTAKAPVKASKKPASKKPVAKKPAAKKPVAKKPPAAKPATKKLPTKKKPLKQSTAKSIGTPPQNGTAAVVGSGGAGMLCKATGTAPIISGYTLVEIRAMVVAGQNAPQPPSLFTFGLIVPVAQNWTANGVPFASGGGAWNTLWVGYRFVKMGIPPQEQRPTESVSFTGTTVSTCP